MAHIYGVIFCLYAFSTAVVYCTINLVLLVDREHLLRKPANETTTEKRTTTDSEDDHRTTGGIDRRMDVLAAVVLKAARAASPPCILVKFRKLMS